MEETPLRLDASRIRKLYRETLTTHREELTAGCHRAGVAFTSATTDEDLAMLLVRALTQGDSIPPRAAQMILYAILVGGVAAVAVPLAVHVLHKRRITQMDWGAMRFLIDMLARSKNKIRLEEILLLLIRMGIVACLASP